MEDDGKMGYGVYGYHELLRAHMVEGFFIPFASLGFCTWRWGGI